MHFTTRSTESICKQRETALRAREGFGESCMPWPGRAKTEAWPSGQSGVGGDHGRPRIAQTMVNNLVKGEERQAQGWASASILAPNLQAFKGDRT